jgi:5-methyltetrahydrofolate--homocysteine methyltransferase
MVPAQKILDTAEREGCDIVGLSGLITPSLEEMSFVAAEMARRGMRQPLLIGGATTSKVHTALRIAPHYGQPVVHVLDASRAVGVAQSLLSDGLRERFAADVAAEYADIREKRGQRKAAEPRQGVEAARANRAPIDVSVPVPVPRWTGARTFDQYPLADLVDRIDWTPFFQTWELAGHFPAILDDPVVGETARSLYADARAMLDRIVHEQWLTARAVVGFWPAHAEGDDIALFADAARTEPVGMFRTLRQQMVKRDGRPNLALSDWVAPSEAGVTDYVGAFCVTTGVGIDEHVARFEAQHDDYSAILLKALADRLAEAFAERMHEQVRREHWGYAPEEALDNAALIREQYQGIRPAPGYPACPDHTEKATLFELLGVPAAIGVTLTESMAMLPTASVSGYYFWRPEAKYFGVGKIERDQLEDYAARKGVPVEEAARWLAPVLNDEVGQAAPV